MLREIVGALRANANVVLLAGVAASVAWLLYRRYSASQELQLPFLKFEDGDDSRQRYVFDSPKLFKIGYERVRLATAQARNDID